MSYNILIVYKIIYNWKRHFLHSQIVAKSTCPAGLYTRWKIGTGMTTGTQVRYVISYYFIIPVVGFGLEGVTPYIWCNTDVRHE